MSKSKIFIIIILTSIIDIFYSDDNDNTGNIRPSKYVPNDMYYEDQVLDPRIEYRLMVN